MCKACLAANASRMARASSSRTAPLCTPSSCTFPIDIIYADRKGKVLKVAPSVKPFKLVAAPMRAFYAIELPDGAIERSNTQAGDMLVLDEELETLSVPDLTQKYAA